MGLLIVGRNNNARSLRSPLKRSERYSAAGIEPNTFSLEESPLASVVWRPSAEPSVCIHDAMPRNRPAWR
jgi:hypothetical protein